MRVLPVLGLMILAPVSAEYLLGYDDLIRDPASLVWGLWIFAPLYGAPAVIIREMARRRGQGWPTILLLSAAAGLIQAGLIDQSLFNPDYRGIPYWATLREPTYLPGLGFSAYMLIIFVGGHMIQSFAAPIAIVESLVPRRATRPWLGTGGLVVMAVLYLAAAAFILADQATTEQFVAAPGQLMGAAIAVLALVGAALVVPRRQPQHDRSVPRPLLVVAAAVVLLAVYGSMPTTWLGVAGQLVLLGTLGTLVWRWSRSTQWDLRHVLAVAAAPLLVNAAMAFTIEPLGSGPALTRYATNAVLAFGVVVLLSFAAHRARIKTPPGGAPPRPDQPAQPGRGRR